MLIAQQLMLSEMRCHWAFGLGHCSANGVCWSFRMARNARPTAAKREREKALIERRQQKFARRQDAKTKKPTNESDAGEDPDIAHIKPGPQPLADWQVEE
jgi:hypothetical protein